MKKACLMTIVLTFVTLICFAEGRQPVLTFENLFPKAKQREMGLHKLTAVEREALRSHVESLLVLALSAKAGGTGGGVYAGVGSGHWIENNIDSGSFIVLEDGSLWKIDPLEKIDAMLWLPVSDITVIESSGGSPGYDYLLVNTDDGEKAHAKYMGQQ